MAELNTEAKLKNLLKQEKIQLWNPPYTDPDHNPGTPHMQELAERFAPLLCLPTEEVSNALESIRVQAVKRGKGNKMFRETNVATLELLLPKDSKKDPKTRNFLETKLDVLVQVVVDRIREEYGLKNIKLILNGKTLSTERRLEQQGVRNHSKMMVLKVSDSEWKQQMSEEEEKRKSQLESIRRTQKGFQILSERDGSDDPGTTPFLEIADQKGNPLKIPHSEKKVLVLTGAQGPLASMCPRSQSSFRLHTSGRGPGGRPHVDQDPCHVSQALILAMGFHEKGRSLMKRKQYDNALCHLLQADQQFSQCGSALLSSVDNYAVLQLDIVWCYQVLEALSCLDDGRSRLQRAEDCFLQCYGEQQQRLLMIKGNTGSEEVLFLRLYLLQSLLSYIEGNDAQARHQLTKVESLYARLCLDSEKMTQLMSLGFTEREARLGLRACQGDMQEAAIHISNRRQEREQMKQRERQKRKRLMEGVTSLMELGYARRDATRALHHADGDVDKAYAILLDSDQTAVASSSYTDGAVGPEKLEQLLYLGFERAASEAALRLTGGDVQSATQLLLDNQGVLSPELLSDSSSPSSEEPSTSSSISEDSELVNEVLEDLSHHEEDYLDLTLEEESQLIATMKSYLSRGAI
ncbi:NEDD8 ultimate buster 1 isoform 1-T6 [Aulostomus maculatus]